VNSAPRHHFFLFDARLTLPLHRWCCRACQQPSVSTGASLPPSKHPCDAAFHHLVITGLFR
jgi:hypothetical protein